MPGRYLREGILDSDRVDMLSNAEEVFYRRLMSAVDDFGVFDGRPSILKSKLYPLRTGSVREAEITRWIAACEKARLLVLYHVDGKPYVYYGNLGEPRAKTSKYPPPPPEAIAHLAFASICAHARADAPPTPTPTPTSPPTPTGGGGSATHTKAEIEEAICKVSDLNASKNTAALAAELLARTPPVTVAELHEFGRLYHQICTYSGAKARSHPTLNEIRKYVHRVRPKAKPTSAKSAAVKDNREREKQDAEAARIAKEREPLDEFWSGLADDARKEIEDLIIAAAPADMRKKLDKPSVEWGIVTADWFRRRIDEAIRDRMRAKA